ncbi:heat shock protein HtpX [Methanocaldococcus villosus KIN24-T80]|uniref:Protease HtpX homolog n=1 Tax=Methanocaldococcus villosus KIN24-T80 TaxID=1069083 RepID=N6UVN4_9EURY|nr:zinc metalloprotease HtpX [Methanocaldococcus villosus]ENN96404.1 heat shock protein HtpX [Methanocaldococcus villosus KIN24-T80]
MSFLIQAKTYLLMAFLIGLIYAICLLLHIPPIFAIIIALIPNLIAYFLSDKIVLASYGARILDEHEMPWLHDIVRRVARKAGIPKPKVAIVPIATPNAFATGRNPENAVVAVTEGILNILSPEELEGVIGHEIAHIKHRDILLATIVATLAGAITYIAEWFMWFGHFFVSEEEENPLQIVATLLLIILAPIAATLIQLAISRQREFYADEDGARWTHPLWLANALAKLERSVELYPLKEGNPATAHLFIVNPFRGDFIAKLFSTHPPTEERIRRLMEMYKRGWR